MGRGNVNVTGMYEGVYYIANADIYVYRNPKSADFDSKSLRELSIDDLIDGWEYDDILSAERTEWVLESFIESFIQKFHSFYRANPDEWLGRTKRIILESGLFYVCVEDNGWSLAVELIQKENDDIKGFQKRQFKNYLSKIKASLYEVVPKVYYRTSAWTSDVAAREERVI